MSTAQAAVRSGVVTVARPLLIRSVKRELATRERKQGSVFSTGLVNGGEVDLSWEPSGPKGQPLTLLFTREGAHQLADWIKANVPAE